MGSAGDEEARIAAARLRHKVRYADPAAWLVVAAVERALEAARVEPQDLTDRVGIILISEDGPAETIHTVALAAREGQISPLRFAAVTPASLVGTVCIVFGFHGPTLTLTCPTSIGLPPARAVADGWLTRGVADWIVMVTTGRSLDCSVAESWLLCRSPEA
jgi:3-oxoacyl-(acyl-carrier-protein) synthase